MLARELSGELEYMPLGFAVHEAWGNSDEHARRELLLGVKL
jgi:hypothetical protein